MLRNAGWTVDEDKKDSHDVKQEFLVKHQPTNSGEGYADYVYDSDSDKPLAVIEAKRHPFQQNKEKPKRKSTQMV